MPEFEQQMETQLPPGFSPEPKSAKPAANPLASYFRQPKIYIKLPSEGRFYPDGSIDRSEIGEYAVYAMTAKDELLFKTPDALMNGQATVEVIKSCIPAITNPWNMPSIDIDAALIGIRIATYGEGMDIESDCPSCEHHNEYKLNLLAFLDQASNFKYESQIEVAPLTVNIRPYSYKEITKTTLRSLEQQKILSVVTDDNLSDEEKLERFGTSFVKLTELTVDVITGCISSIETPDSVVTDQTMIREFIENSSSEVFNKISDHVSKMKEAITLRAHDVECEECQNKFTIELTMDQANFFGNGS